MNILPQTQTNVITARSKLYLFDVANGFFNKSLDFSSDDPEARNLASIAEAQYQEFLFVFRILGIFDEYMQSSELDVNEALEKGLDSWQAARVIRLLAS